MQDLNNLNSKLRIEPYNGHVFIKQIPDIDNEEIGLNFAFNFSLWNRKHGNYFNISGSCDFFLGHTITDFSE